MVIGLCSDISRDEIIVLFIGFDDLIWLLFDSVIVCLVDELYLGVCIGDATWVMLSVCYIE